MKLAIVQVFGLLASTTLAAPAQAATEATQSTEATKAWGFPTSWFGKQSVDVVQSSVDKVVASVKVLNQAMAKGTGSDGDSATRFLQDALRENRNVVEALRTGAASINANNNGIYAGQAMTIAMQLGPMANQISTAMTAWIAAKPAAQVLGAKNAVIDGLTLAQSESSLFLDAILNQENWLNYAMGQNAKTQIKALFDKAIAEYRKN
ncbi:hypothetical protein BT63DRAFT_193646 [Microthyrium microscopicum]|uniref:DUF4142 domain-containing protein n=1 Tax=Microthyrium microscopicum TaxID=703497 RepID=A0A6A6UJD9_9PEZI|nr:hypothetical protein BT63DRAFT_193646 [Microthyrium microscopicum]